MDAFAIFCGMGITNVMNFQAVSQANAKLKVPVIIIIYLHNYQHKWLDNINADYSSGHNGRTLIPSSGNNFELWNFYDYGTMGNCQCGAMRTFSCDDRMTFSYMMI